MTVENSTLLLSLKTEGEALKALLFLIIIIYKLVEKSA